MALQFTVMSAPRVLVPDVEPPEVTLPADEAHHVMQVLRLEAGDPIVVFDGAGCEWDARLASVAKRAVTATILQARTPVPEPATRVILAIGLLKGDAMDEVVRDATALGVAAIVPMITTHCVVPKRARGDEAIARWRRVAVSSAKQCGRATLPELRAPAPFLDVLRVAADVKLICLEPTFPGVSLPAFATVPRTALLLIGPEGGWSRDEVASARLAGCQGLQLGPLTLRAELAPAVALSQFWAVFS